MTDTEPTGTTPPAAFYRVYRVDRFDGSRDHVATVTAALVADELAARRAAVVRDLDGAPTADFEAVPFDGPSPTW